MLQQVERQVNRPGFAASASYTDSAGRTVLSSRYLIMGNEVSNSEVEEEQEGPVEESNPEFAVEVKNGPVTLQSSPALNSAPGLNQVSSKQVVQQESMITSSQKTIVLSPISNGSVANPSPPAAKSKFRLTISRPSPGRTSFQPNGPEDVGSVKPEITLQQSPVVQTQLMTPIGPDSLAKENVGGVQNQAPTLVVTTPEALLSSTNPTEEEMSFTKPKEVSIFQRIFKIEKMQSTPQPEVTINEPVLITVDQTAALQSSPPSDDLQPQSVDDYDQAASAEEQSASEETENTPPAELHPVMSFFKTLVTPNKSLSKSEEEVKTEGADKKKENGGFRKSSSKKEKHKSSVQQTSEMEAKNLKKSESPKSGTLSRLFKQKSKKDEQQTSGSKVVVEQSVVSVSVNSGKSPPEQVVIQDPKSSDVPTQITASEGESKAAKESTASRPKLFWRKSFKGEPQSNKIQENGVEEQATLSASADSTPEQILVEDTKLPDTNIQPQENEKPVVEPPSRSVPFWRKSFKGDPQPRKIQDNVVVEQPVVSVSINAEKSAPEQVLTPDTKPLESDSQQTESEKPQKEAVARSVPFWRKSFKADPPPQKVSESVVVEEPVVSVSVNSEKSPPEQVLTLETKPLDSVTQQAESEKPQKEAAARPVLFWRKSFKGDPQPPKVQVQENSVPAEEPQTVQLTLTSSSEPEPQSSKSNPGEKGATAGRKSPEAQNKKPEEGKTTKPKIMMFFKQLSVMGDGNNISGEESNEKSNQEPTLDITDGVEISKNEKTVVTAVVEPPPPPPLKGKDNVKEKKGSAEKLNKQESRESAEAVASAQIQAQDPAQVDNGVGASKDGQLKRTEKRQSLGSFFKAIGPKRMCDAEVQTDPVTIFPAEKTK
ncbi:breast carcinoma-amplified sequence 1 isoform X3 [Phyllobates terribilis]|uniref:breast carcinoma-amplified sequence 1 isoform X3 n=1 Tax=Phyllobates terribilis TaxID=111132 RepID=UPI003CCB2D5E